MMFWLAALALTLVASLAVLLPISRKPGADSPDSAHDLTVYRDQLAEVERDRERGALGPEEAEQARVEIARRIIKIDAENKHVSAKMGGSGRVLASIAVLSVPLVSWAMYAAIGSPGLPSQPLAARLEKAPSESSPEELVARAEKELALNPDDARGWGVLAPIYMRMGRFNDAATAFRNAMRLTGEDAEKLSGLGEALLMAGGGIVTTEAEDAFKRALALDPKFAKARYFLALGLMQDGKLAEAANGWRAIAADEPADAPWRRASEAALSQLQGQQPDQPQTAETQPPAEQPPAVTADQQAMIEEMVAGLDERLRSEPNDPDGWIRLLRSYQVLGRGDAARDALKRALAALGADSEAGKRIAAFAVEQGVTQ